MGNGKEVYKYLNKDEKMKKLLDDIGINFFDGDYHVVDLAKKKVVTSAVSKKGKGDDSRHRAPLDSWRQQPDLMSAIIGISEDPATREAVAESQYAVYLDGAASWSGQGKVFTTALYFMITHMNAWYPAFGKHGFDVNDVFKAVDGVTPSVDTDKKMALRIARGFVKYGKKWFEDHNYEKSSYEDLRLRTKTRLWKTMADDGKKEGFDPGELTYDFD
jgi:hypothetical protein